MRPLKAAAALIAGLALAGCAGSAATQSVTISGNKLTIYISEPPGYQSDPQLADTIDAEQLAYTQHASEVTSYKLNLQPVQGSELSDNARTAISNKHAIAYIGELTPGASEQSAGITNAQDLLQVSPADTALELTQKTAADSVAPKHFYESYSTYGKTFARVVPNSAVEAQAQVTEMKALGVTELYIASDGTPYGAAMALAVGNDAKSSGLTVASSESAANGVFDGSSSPSQAAKVFAAAPASAKRFAPSALDTTAFATAAGSDANVYVSAPGLLKPTSLGQQFITAFTAKYGHAPASQAIFGYEAMSAVLDTVHLAGSGASDRKLVVDDFFAIRNRTDSVIGPYSIKAGDTSFDSFVFSQLKGGTLVPFVQVQG